jgi:hypothetical protein
LRSVKNIKRTCRFTSYRKLYQQNDLFQISEKLKE